MLNTGGLIVAAGNFGKNERISPFLKLGSVSVIRRIVMTFQQANIKPIVVVTGYQALEIEQHLAEYDVIFLRNENYEHTDKFYSVKLGLDYMKDKCEKIVFTPVTIPTYTAETVKKMIELNKQVVVPVHRGRRGHPLLLSSELVDAILEYKGEGGLNTAVREVGGEGEYIEVEDRGVVLNAEQIEKWNESMEVGQLTSIHPFVRINLEKETSVFDSRARLLLTLIDEVKSVKGACKYMALSIGKAWSMINELESALGYPVVNRRQGGKRGGQTCLTEEGRIFLKKYKAYEEVVRKYSYEAFFDIFDEYRKNE